MDHKQGKDLVGGDRGGCCVLHSGIQGAFDTPTGMQHGTEGRNTSPTPDAKPVINRTPPVPVEHKALQFRSSLEKAGIPESPMANNRIMRKDRTVRNFDR